MNPQKLFITLAAVLLTFFGAYAQSDGQGNDKGHLSGSFETNTIYYTDDEDTGARIPNGDRIGSNNYIKLDYAKSSFTAGVQMEGYFPVLYGYPTELDGVKLTGYYASWSDKYFHVTAGTFYDQFGSGLLFRAWEDRAMGINNSLTGVRLSFNYGNRVAVRVLTGKPRAGMDLADVLVRGADLSVGLSNIFGWSTSGLSLEASVLNKHQKVPIVLEEELKPDITGWSGRLNYEAAAFSARAEYVDAGTNYYAYTDAANPTRSYYGKRGNAQLAELGYQAGGLGIFVTGRRLEWLNSRFDRNSSSIANVMSYIPAATQQYTYLLTNLHPYTPIMGDMQSSISGEIGGQAGVFYNFRKGSALGGRRGLKLNANFSTYYTIAEEGTAKAGNLLFRDLSVNADKPVSKKLRLSLLYSMQERNLSYGERKGTALSHIGVVDILYKFSSKTSLRGELQYLHTKEDEKDWAALLLELNFAPKWSIYASDMYNHGLTEVHYYNVGFSFAHSRTRLSLGWGRNREGYVCSGGVCRLVPAYTGGNFAMTISF